MSDQKQLFLFGQVLPGVDATLLERFQSCARYRNTYGAVPTKALEKYSANQIIQLVVGHNSIAFLFRDNRIARLGFNITQNKIDVNSTIEKPASAVNNISNNTNSATLPTENISNDGNAANTISTPSISSSNGAQLSNQSSNYAAATAATVAANRTAKIRRVMMAARRPGGFCSRGGVIVDRARPLVPAASIPEELISQALVVLQGKSRDVIIRELQRTNLNVNEAVNNLLSRDDDEGEDFDETSEAYLHEELLSLLDAGLRSEGNSSIIEHDNIYASAEGYDYLVSRDLARRREEAKFKDRAKENTDNNVSLQDYILPDDNLQFWCDQDGNEFPPGVKKFIKIVAMHSELIALADNGRLYSWSWGKNDKPSNVPHYVNAQFFNNSETNSDQTEKIIDIEACAWKSIILTNSMKIGGFIDISCGNKLSEIFFEPLIDLPSGESVEKLHVSPLFSVVQTKNDRLYWRGAYPYNERRKLFEKARNKNKKHVTFEVNEIVVGSEVRTKSAPIYSAGCVAVNFTGGVPIIGTLMESAWTLSETCRFRVQAPLQFDCADNSKKQQQERKISFNISVRKRAAPSDEGSSNLTNSIGQSSNASSASFIKETAWSLKDVIFVKEEIVNDIAVVKIVDGAYCGIVYKSALEKQNSNISDEALNNNDIGKMGLRLMRKDDLVIVPSSGKTLRAPDSFQRALMPVILPSNVKLISMAVDTTGFRILVEKKNRVHLLRMSCLGKLFSDHIMPLSLNILCKSIKEKSKNKPCLENYGDDGVLVLRDAVGNLVSLMRNAAGGFREPAYIGLGQLHNLSIGLRFLKSLDEVNCSTLTSCEQLNPTSAKNTVNKNANRMVVIAAIIAPSPESINPPVPSLMQSILYCDLEYVRFVLFKLASYNESDAEELRVSEILNSRIDGNRNILHAVVMNCFATTNKDDADKKIDEPLVKIDETEAENVRSNFDRKWQEMISGQATNITEEKTFEAFVRPPISNKDRQYNSIQICQDLVSNPIIRPYFLQLMRERDINGYTPFNCAVQMRAYTAASILWNALESFKNFSNNKSNDKETLNSVSELHEIVSGLKADDSPLFVLCYNDTCSFTWTGEDHINQDIFECKTCGLTATFCCCTECAYTCHRNHDCRLKKTSPTAYCDCWEKCSCKALVTGNSTQREYLLSQLIKHTNLITYLNSKGEHLLLFLAKTVARQLIEQDPSIRQINKVRTNHQTQSNNVTIPEHDLDPPKFARRAFDIVLSNWASLKSLLEVGIKSNFDEVIVVEEIFHLGEQNGSTHLDKFVFALLARCHENQLDILLNTLITQANIKSDKRDPKIDMLISRFVRSVIRLFTLISIISSSATGLLLSAISCSINDFNVSGQISTSKSIYNTSVSSGNAKSLLSNYRAVAISGMLSLVRASLPPLNGSTGKEFGEKSLHMFLLKCRRVFQSLVSYSIVELLNASDALIAPVRLGMVKPSIYNQSSDALEVIERFLNGEKDLTTLLSLNKDLITINKRKKGNLTNYDEGGNVSNINNMREGEDTDSDSDSDNDDRPSRRLNSQGSVNLGIEETSVVQSQSSRAGAQIKKKNGHSQLRRLIGSGNHRNSFNSAIYVGDSADSFSSPSDESEEDDDEDDDDSSSNGFQGNESQNNNRYTQVRNRIGNLNYNEGNNDDDIEIDGDRDMEDEEEDAYFNMDDEEDDVESGNDEVEGEDLANAINASDSSDTVPVEQEEITVQLLESNHNNSVQENAINLNNSQFVSINTTSNTDSGTLGATNDLNNEENTNSNRFSRLNEQSGEGNSVSALNWAVNRIQQENENETARTADIIPTDTTRTENRPNTEAESTTTDANVGSQSNTTNSVSSNRLRYRMDGDELNNVVGQTSMQLSMCFLVLVKLIDELTLELLHYKNWTKNEHKGLKNLLTVDTSILPTIRQLIEQRYETTWKWLFIVMDRTEAKLKFGNSLASSSIGAFISANNETGKARTLELKKEEKRHKKKENHKTDSKKNVNNYNVSNKSDFFCSYFFSLLRSHSSENGDNFPVIEFNVLKSVAFIVEAYLFHINLMDELEIKISALSESNEDGEQMDVDVSSKTVDPIRRFYQRSKSICYPFISIADNHHAFKYTANDCLPLSTRSHLLRPDADRNTLFSLPIPHRTRESHKKIAQEHGNLYPNHHSLADPPIVFSDILNKTDKIDCSLQDAMNINFKPLDTIKNKKHDIFNVDSLLNDSTSVSNVALHRCLGRWSNTLLFLSKVFHEQIIACCGGDASLSILLNETADYHIRQLQFRKRMEKFKASQTKDLSFMNMSRDKQTLLSSTIRQLNHQYVRRSASASTNNTTSLDSFPNPILASQKVKVMFRDEPGEGTGVARSFYSAIADAFLTMQQLPSDMLQVNEDGSLLTEEVTGSGNDWNSTTARRSPQSVSPTRNFISRISKRSSTRQNDGNLNDGNSESYRIRTRSQRSSTSILSQNNTTLFLSTSRRSSGKSSKIDENSKTAEHNSSEKINSIKDNELKPLFFKTPNSSFYTVIPENNSSTRLNAFRNVGRIIGTCIQQMEIFPIFLCRHIFKFILNRPITWFDLAFFDSTLFDSLRSIVYNECKNSSHSDEFYDDLQLTFAVDISPEEGGGVLELKPNGANILVSKDNVLEYIYLFVENRLLGNHLKALEAIRRGVFDVIPSDSLNNLTPEDLRLILCGNQDISVALLESYTTFSDESSASPEVLAKYKQWFWSVVSKFNAAEKQDLVFFWTGSPFLPSTEKAFQPLPSIMVRPSDDHHLPTANTCISRLYVPLYSSKKIMRAKLLLAIKARDFGFV